MKPPPPPPPDDDETDEKLSERIEKWERTVRQTVEGYRLTLDDWLNDMDVRQAIADALPLAPPSHAQFVRRRLATLDEQFRHATAASKTCLWGTRIARIEGWKAKRNWWYFRIPLIAAPELMAEIEAVA